MRSRSVVILAVMLSTGCSGVLAAESGSAARAAFQARQQRLAALGDRSSKVASLSERVFVDGFDAPVPSCDNDRDGDGLPDCVETATGRFVDISDTGTDPDQADTDGDGLGDGDEVLGTLDGLDLPALGANPLRRDLLVEYDWFDDARECALHSHAPSQAVLDRVATLFASSALVNPDGSTGIHLIQDVGQGGAFDGGELITDFEPVLPGALDDHYAAIKQAHFADNRRGYFHYVLMPHRYNASSSSSGYAEVVGDDAIVSLYCLNTDDNVARTIMHELGHNLGLQHGGFEACNGKPNYNSVMNYRYQFAGIDDSCNAFGDGTEGFSAGDRLPLDEHALNENLGVCGSPPIDWNADGAYDNDIAKDLNPGYDADCGGSLGQLEDFDDWAHVTLAGIRDGGLLKAASVQQEIACGGAPVPKP